MKKMLIAVVCCATLGLAGCNTVRGVGQDVESGGSAVSHAATHAQQKM